jgi:TonB family protein
VKINVQEYRELSIAVGATDLPPASDGYRVTISAPPAQAKALASNMVLLLSGRLRAEDGTVATCSSDTDGATISDPIEVYSTSCLLKARITKVEISDGVKAYAVWPAPNRAPDVTPAGVIANPNWARKASAADIVRYYPYLAQKEGVNGRATVSCVATEGGALDGCSIESEGPAGYGFGDAALKLTKLFQMKPKTVDGSPTPGGQVTFPIAFEVPR